MVEDSGKSNRHVAVGVLILTNTAKHGRAALLIKRPPHIVEEKGHARVIFRQISFGRVFQVTSHARLDDGAYGPLRDDLKSFLPAIMKMELGELTVGSLGPDFLQNYNCSTK